MTVYKWYTSKTIVHLVWKRHKSRSDSSVLGSSLLNGSFECLSGVFLDFGIGGTKVVNCGTQMNNSSVSQLVARDSKVGGEAVLIGSGLCEQHPPPTPLKNNNNNKTGWS